MTKTIYHGSDHIISVPQYGGGKAYNDYGHGFYCTESANMASEWAVGEDHDGYANQYELDMTGLKTLYLNRDYTILTWLAVLLQNRVFNYDSPLAQEAAGYLKRNFSVDTEKYDLIYGYRADDSYFTFAKDFLNGSISYEQLSYAMYLGEMGMQLVLKSRRAFEQIRFVNTVRALRSNWLNKKMLRDLKARSAYLNSDRMHFRRVDIYVTTILREEIKDGDPRLQ